jgi:hypothetical protein
MPYAGYAPQILGYGPQILGEDVDVLGRVDIMGEDDDLMGLSDDELMGALFRRKKKKAKMLRAAGAASNVVQSVPATSTRRMSLQFDSGVTIAAGATVTLPIVPPEPFRGEALRIDPTIAPAFVINSITIGRSNQLLGTGSLACSLCSPDNPFPVQWDTAQTSQPIQLAVTNTSGAALRFMGDILGTVVTR